MQESNAFNMNDRANHYKGREQSYIKHRFLTTYLQSAAFKILQSRTKIFNFVDAFAGPWKVSDDNYSDASFDQAIRTLEGVRTSLGGGIKIRFCFCEQRADSVAKLYEYAEQQNRFEIHILPGKFEENLSAIQNICNTGYTFTFVDPTGWNIDNGPIFGFLKKQKGEFIFNFMADSINRHATYELVSESLGRFLADPNWIVDFNSEPSCLSNEERVLRVLKRKIREAGSAIYVPDFPILNPYHERIKMRLLLGTFSPAGVEVFRDVQEKIEKVEIITRNRIRDERLGINSLFDAEEIAALQQEDAGIGCSRYLEKAERKIKALVPVGGYMEFKVLGTSVMESVPIRLVQLKKLLKDLKDKSVVDYQLPPGKRVPQPDTLVQLIEE